MWMPSIVRKIGVFAKWLTYKNQCLLCHQPSDTWLCPSCYQAGRCQQLNPMAYEPGHYYGYHYDGVIRQLLYLVKFKHDLLAAAALSEYLMDWFDTANWLEQFDAIIPVPIHRKRYRQRGFNQSIALIKPVAAYFQIPLEIHTCYRRYYTQPQAQSTREQRQRQLTQVFAQRHPLAYRHVAIFDDVYTTGATVDALRQRLLTYPGNHIEQVSVITLCHAGK